MTKVPLHVRGDKLEEQVHDFVEELSKKYGFQYKIDVGFVEFPRPWIGHVHFKRIKQKFEQKMKELGYTHYDIFEEAVEPTIVVDFPEEKKEFEEGK